MEKRVIRGGAIGVDGGNCYNRQYYVFLYTRGGQDNTISDLIAIYGIID